MPGNTGKRRSASQLSRDRRAIAEYYLKGWLQSAIAAELGISQQTVSNDLRALQVQWEKSALRDFDTMRGEELAKIDNLEREYWAGWLRSGKNEETLVKKAKDGKGTEAIKTSKGQAGDPRFLAGIERCIERRCKLLGIDAPAQHEHRVRFGVAEWREERAARLAAIENDDLMENGESALGG